MIVRAIFAIVVLGAIPAVAETSGAPVAAVTWESPSHYCGLHCVYAVAQVHGVRFNFESLVDAKYLTGRDGSTAANLSSALSDVGLHGDERAFLTIDRLRFIDQPLILHVRSPGLGAQYRHWVLFLGFDGDRLRLYDPPRDLGNVTAAELLSIWDGAGIIVGKNRQSAATSIPLSFSFAAFVAGAAILVHLLSR